MTKTKRTRRTTARFTGFELVRAEGVQLLSGQAFTGEINVFTNGEIQVMYMYRKLYGRGISHKRVEFPDMASAEAFVTKELGCTLTESRVLRPITMAV